MRKLVGVTMRQARVSWTFGVWIALAAVLPLPAVAERSSSILIDANTGEILVDQNSDAPRFPASLTKMMTLFLVFDALKDGRMALDRQIDVSAAAATQRPSSIGLRKGDRLSVEQAIGAVVTKSANDAAVALAESLAPTEVQFAEAMTARAKKLGLHDTVFRNATGLPNWRQRTTARDMALLAQALISEHPGYYRFFSTAEFTWKQSKFANHNQMLSDYGGVDGIKTGYIRASGFNLVTSAERDGRRLIGVVFGAPSPRMRDQRMTELLDRGFALPAGTGANIATASAPRQFLRLPDLIASAIAAVPEVPKRGFWAVQVGAFVDRIKAEKRAESAASLAPNLFIDRDVDILSSIERGRPVYRARLTGFEEGDARQACRELKRRGMVCAVVPPAAAAN
jgi:D-alanyl-D-alanine carboxypeptidase